MGNKLEKKEANFFDNRCIAALNRVVGEARVQRNNDFLNNRCIAALN